MQSIGNLEHKFSISARYCHFSLSAWSRIENFDIFHETKMNTYSQKMNDLHLMKNVQIFHFYHVENEKYHCLAQMIMDVSNF